MRTTLDIADDVLYVAKERARREKKSAGQVISELARAALTGHRPDDVGTRTTRFDMEYDLFRGAARSSPTT